MESNKIIHQNIDYKDKHYSVILEKLNGINHEVKLICLDDNKTIFLESYNGYYVAFTVYKGIIEHPEKYIDISNNKYQNTPDGVYVELFAVKDGKRYNYKELSMKELSLTLTTSLMDGIDKICK